MTISDDEPEPKQDIIEILKYLNYEGTVKLLNGVNLDEVFE